MHSFEGDVIEGHLQSPLSLQGLVSGVEGSTRRFLTPREILEALKSSKPFAEAGLTESDVEMRPVWIQGRNARGRQDWQLWRRAIGGAGAIPGPAARQPGADGANAGAATGSAESATVNPWAVIGKPGATGGFPGVAHANPEAADEAAAGQRRGAGSLSATAVNEAICAAAGPTADAADGEGSAAAPGAAGAGAESGAALAGVAVSSAAGAATAARGDGGTAAGVAGGIAASSAEDGGAVTGVAVGGAASPTEDGGSVTSMEPAAEEAQQGDTEWEAARQRAEVLGRWVPACKMCGKECTDASALRPAVLRHLMCSQGCFVTYLSKTSLSFLRQASANPCVRSSPPLSFP